MMVTDAMRAAVPAQLRWPRVESGMPEPCYPCVTHGCAVKAFYLAYMLRWCRDGFYCESCIDELFYDIVAIDNDEIYNGPSLADVLNKEVKP